MFRVFSDKKLFPRLFKSLDSYILTLPAYPALRIHKKKHTDTFSNKFV